MVDEMALTHLYAYPWHWPTAAVDGGGIKQANKSKSVLLPPPPPAPLVATARSDADHLDAITSSPTAARAVARSNEEHLDAIKQKAAVHGFNGLMGEIGEGTQLRSTETVDKSVPMLEADAHDVTESPAMLLKDLIPHFPDTKEFLRKVETVDKSGPMIDEDVTIAFADPSDTRSPHLKAIAAAAEKRHYRLLHQLKGAMASMFASSGIELERAFRGFDENGDGQLDYGEFSRGLKNLGVALGEQQLEDLVTILDRDGDGTIDYTEFANWFGAGPPPPPLLPEVMMRQQARSAGSFDDPEAHLKAIRQKAVDLGTAANLKAAPPPIKKAAPPPLHKKGPPPLKKGPPALHAGKVPPPPSHVPPPPPPSLAVVGARDNTEHLDAIKQKAAVHGFNGLMGEIGEGTQLRSTE
eukprot:COSAG02_NODE_14076_length_1313_cov_1.795717_1_plen_409_part_10